MLMQRQDEQQTDGNKCPWSRAVKQEVDALGKAMLGRAPAHSRAKVASGSVFAAVKNIWQALGMVHRYMHAT